MNVFFLGLCHILRPLFCHWKYGHIPTRFGGFLSEVYSFFGIRRAQRGILSVDLLFWKKLKRLNHLLWPSLAFFRDALGNLILEGLLLFLFLFLEIQPRNPLGHFHFHYLFLLLFLRSNFLDFPFLRLSRILLRYHCRTFLFFLKIPILLFSLNYLLFLGFLRELYFLEFLYYLFFLLLVHYLCFLLFLFLFPELELAFRCSKYFVLQNPHLN